MATHRSAFLQGRRRWRLPLFFGMALMCLCGCGANGGMTLPGPISPVASPVSPLRDSGVVLADSFVSRLVGRSYFDDHFVLSSYEQAGGLVKVTYYYSYSPYVADWPMTLFLEREGGQMATVQVSTILLDAQEFVLDPEQGLRLAVENGLDASTQYHRELYLGVETGNRFAYRFIGAPDASLDAPEGALLDLALDVEDGTVHFRELVGLTWSGG